MIAVVVPTVRKEQYSKFKDKWDTLFRKHGVCLITIWDGENPVCSINNGLKVLSVEEIMGCKHSLIYNLNDGVRNLGFAFIAKYLPEAEYIITFDDDVLPIGDPIQDHIDALNKRVSTSWISTLVDDYPRGFPYAIRDESEVVLSHGVWEGVKDWDAPTQLVKGNPDATFYRGVIPWGTYYPMCGMNIAFKRKMLPYMYFAPMGYRVGMDRFADIWCGIKSKDVIDENDWAVVTGYSKVLHKRASNTFTNLVKESKGLGLNERFWLGIEEDPYFKEYEVARNKWKKWIDRFLQ